MFINELFKVVVIVGVVVRTACWGLSGRGAVRPGVVGTAGWVRGCRQLAGRVRGCRQLAERQGAGNGDKPAFSIIS